MRTGTYRLIIFFVLALSATVSAEGLYDRAMSKGMASLERQDFAAAEEAFREALREAPEDFSATLRLGVLLNRNGSKEAESLLKKALRMDPQDPEVNLNLGIIYYRKNAFPEARDYLETVAEVAPGTVHQAEADRYLSRMKEARPKPWALAAAVGIQYDSNVILGPGNAPLPEGITRKSDWKALLYAKGEYEFVRKENFRAGAGYSILQTIYTKLADFNITQQVAGLNASYAFSDAVMLKGTYAYEYVLVGGERYDDMHALTPSLVINHGRGLATTLDYTYSNFHFSDSSLFLNNSDRTGFNHRLGISELIRMSDSVEVRAGYAYDKDNTRKDFWAYNGNKVFANLTFKLFSGLSADLYGDYYWKNYDGTYPGAGTQRKDEAGSCSLTLSKKLSDAVSLVVGQTYIRNKSNINVFDYKRAITSAFLTVRF